MERKRSTPAGLSDCLTEDCMKKSLLVEKIRGKLEGSGYRKIETPSIEYLEVFSGLYADDQTAAIQKFIDHDGSIAALRPDLTIPAARLVATRMKEQEMPLKLWYGGKVFCGNGIQEQDSREFLQLGAEIYGDKSIWTDVECIRMLVECLKAAGLKSFRIDIGHNDILEGVLEELEVPEEKVQGLQRLIDGKNLVELDREVRGMNMDERGRKLMLWLTGGFGGAEEVFASEGLLPAGEKVQAAVQHLKNMYRLLEDTGVDEYIGLDLGMSNRRSYYTGLVFRVYTYGIGRLIAAGGRYDRLLGAFGLDCPAAGFAFYMDRLYSVLENSESLCQKRPRKLVLYSSGSYGKALEYAEQLRAEGIIVNLLHEASVRNVEALAKQQAYDDICRI